MAARFKMNLAARSLVLFAVWTARGASLTEEDPCIEHRTCASCTNARYNIHPNQESTYQFEKSILGSAQSAKSKTSNGSIGSHSEDLSGRNLRGGKARKLDREEFLLRINQFSERQIVCSWCPLDNACHSDVNQQSCGNGIASAPTSTTSILSSYRLDHSQAFARYYECDCPLSPSPYPMEPPSLLPNWMGTFMNETNGAFGSSTLLDISLPGTHDSMTYDLSLKISDDAISHLGILDEALHAASGGIVDLFPGDLEEFLRRQSKTQQLNIVQQLDNGIRFIDFRIMMEKTSKAWYSVHFMQSRHRATYYFKEIREWMDAHPNEIVIIWLSKHGKADAVGNKQYPGVTPEEKQKLWRSYQSIFEGMLIDTRLSSINETVISDLLDRNHRVITFVSDYKEFTDASPFALDGAKIENPLGITGGIFDEPITLERQLAYFIDAPEKNRMAKSQSNFTIMAMNSMGQGWQILAAAQKRFLPHLMRGAAWETKDVSSSEGTVEYCALQMKIPGIQWCPDTLLDIAQLNSYYNQIAFHQVHEWSSLATDGGASVPQVALPNAFYLDALDYDGTIRTGSHLLFGTEREARDKRHSNAKYAYVDTILTYNLNKVCSTRIDGMGSLQSATASVDVNTTKLDWTQSACSSLSKILRQRREKHPFTLWDNPELGRHSNWPVINLDKVASLALLERKPTVKNTRMNWEWMHSEAFTDSWWGLLSPKFTFISFYSVFSSRIRYACFQFGSYLLRFLR